VTLSFLVEVQGAGDVVLGTDRPFDVEDPDPRAHVREAAGLDERWTLTIESINPLRWFTGRSPNQGRPVPNHIQGDASGA
jgi:hypothetical protein